MGKFGNCLIVVQFCCHIVENNMDNMKNLENVTLDFSTPFSWAFFKRKSRLITSDSTITVLKSDGKNKASFIFNDREFRLRSKGFWNNVITFSESGKQLAVVRRSFSG